MQAENQKVEQPKYRHFFVSYHYSTKNGFGFGRILFSSEVMPSIKGIEKVIKENQTTDSICIINIQEFSKEDHDNLISENSSIWHTI